MVWRIDDRTGPVRLAMDRVEWVVWMSLSDDRTRTVWFAGNGSKGVGLSEELCLLGRNFCPGPRSQPFRPMKRLCGLPCGAFASLEYLVDCWEWLLQTWLVLCSVNS